MLNTCFRWHIHLLKGIRTLQFTSLQSLNSFTLNFDLLAHLESYKLIGALLVIIGLIATQMELQEEILEYQLVVAY